MSPTRVLIAEDEPDVRAALAELLASDPGLQVVGVAADTDEAVRLAQARRPDLVVMDVKMPGGGGAEATRRIRRHRPETQVIALSAYQDRATIVDMIRAGAIGYVLKGPAPSEIIVAVHEAAEGLTSLSPVAAAELVHELTSRLQDEEVDAVARQLRAGRIQRAIDGDLRMLFQPIVDLRTGLVAGVEALARFGDDPMRTPDVWLADASELGMRRELETAAFDAAIAQFPSLPDELFLTVNLSPEVVQAGGLWDRVPDATARRLVVEITEHAPIDDYDALNEAFAPLRARGGLLAIDDAGAGFASLRHILLLNADFIKIDGSLVTDLDRDRPRLALTSALITFGSGIGAVVIAEGIERHWDLERVKAHGVTYGQGYLFGRPAALADLEPGLSGRYPVHAPA